MSKIKNNEIKIMTYRELCQEFGEEPKKGGNEKVNQFKRWRKEYSIEKVDGKNSYYVRPLLMMERKQIENSTTNYMYSLRKVMYEYLTKQEHCVKTINELMLDLFLVNEKFFDNTPWFIKQEIELNEDNYLECRGEIKKFITRAIRTVLNELKTNGIILVYDAFEVILDKGSGVEETRLIEKNDGCCIVVARNKFAKEKYGVDYYEELDYDAQCEINKLVNNKFGYKYHRSVVEIYSDTRTVGILLSKPDKYLINKNDAKMMNELSQLKVLTSQQGKLKELTDNQRLKISNKVIKRNV